MNRDPLQKSAVVVALVGVVFACVWLAAGLSSGMLAAIAIGAGTGVAILADPRRTCSLRFLRRRD
jgi:uncharacterized membrane protein